MATILDLERLKKDYNRSSTKRGKELLEKMIKEVEEEIKRK